MFFDRRKDDINYKEINDMIARITVGELGEKKDIRYHSNGMSMHESVYEGERIYLKNIKIYFDVKGCRNCSSTYAVYLDGSLVYRDTDGKIIVPEARETRKSTYDKSWIDELKKVYGIHLKVQKLCELLDENEKDLKQQREIEERKDKIRQREAKKPNYRALKVFEYVYPNGYSDDKIIIDNVNCFVQSRVSYCDGGEDVTEERDYYGRISLADGTIVYDKKKDIYRKGKWEEYVAALAEQFETEEKRRLELARQRYEQGLTEKQKQYKKNHSPIDDSRYFG